MIQWRLARYIICSPGIKFSSTYPIGSSSRPDDVKKGTGYFSRFSKDQPHKINWSEKLPVPILLPALVLGAITDLKAISTRVLEKNGVVTGFPWLGNFMSRSFDVPSSRA